MSGSPSPGLDAPGGVRIWLVALVFPLFMALALPAAYVAALHEPTPHDMAVAVIGTDRAAAGIASAVTSSSDGAVVATTVPDVAAAREALASMEIRGAYDPVSATVYVASAGGPAAVQVVEGVFAGVAEESGRTSTVQDTAPLPADDRLGVSLLFLGIAALICGFVTVTVLCMTVPGISLRTELAVLAVMAVVAAVVTTFTAYSVYGALSGNLLGTAALVAAGVLVAGLVHSGGFKLIGPAMTVVSVLILIILGIPAAGIAIPVEMTNGFFAVLHDLLPTAGLLDGLRRTLYFDGAGIAGDVTILAVWALIGAGMIWLSRLRSGSDSGGGEQPPPTAVEPVSSSDTPVTMEVAR
jgi:hypothetical protein